LIPTKPKSYVRLATLEKTQVKVARAKSEGLIPKTELRSRTLCTTEFSKLAQYELGLALFETGKWKDAAPHFEKAAARSPLWADAHFSLAPVYARINRVPEAMGELDKTLGLNPSHYRANLLCGRLLSLLNKPAEALPNLQKAATVEPNSIEAHQFFADTYAQLGRTAKESKERNRAEMLRGIAQ